MSLKAHLSKWQFLKIARQYLRQYLKIAMKQWNNPCYIKTLYK